MRVFGIERVTVLKVVLVAAATLLAACLVGLVGMENPAEAAFPGLNGKISFAGGDGDIHSMNADGTDQTNLTNTGFPGSEDANWSPDGSKIVFQSLGDIWVMNADGSGRTNLTNTPSVGEQHPTYSFDGTKIAFSRYVDHFQIYVMNADGSGQMSLTDTIGDAYPAWSPDGTKIAFASFRDNNFEIYSMNADGTKQTRLTNIVDDDYMPAWSPDGTKIAFASFRDGAENLEVYSMNADGTNQTNLTNNPAAHDTQPDWQPISDVVYNFSGFDQPVDNLPTLNKTRPGKTIPIRFSLEGYKGYNIFETGYPKSEPIACESTAPVDGIEETVTAKQGLVYDPLLNRYTYDWATGSPWSGCRQFVMKLKDGSVHRANFTFSK